MNQKNAGKKLPNEKVSDDSKTTSQAADATSTPPLSNLNEQTGDSRKELEALKTSLEQREQELAELKDKYLRALADSENARKRFRQQAEEAARLEREGLLRQLLPIVDNLERAVDAARGGGNGKPIVEGVEMVLRSMGDLLKAHGVTSLSAVGERFDPQIHEAVEQVESSQHEPNTVVEEFHRGYQIGDKVLRPARVSVAKPPAEASGDKDNEGGAD